MSFLDETGLERLWTHIIAKLNGFVQSNRTINGKSLETDITLTASDIGALPNTTVIPDALADLTADSTHRLVTDDEKVAWNAKADISDIPTKVSVFENDKGYLTEHQSLEGLATEDWVEEKFEEHSGFVAQPEAPEDTSVLWLDTDDDSTDSSWNVDYVTPQMFGAKGDGVTDDTAAIQAALDGSSFVYIPDGIYMINASNNGWGTETTGGIYPRSGQRIVLSNNAKLKAITNANGFYNVVNIKEVHDVHIIGGIVEGDNASHTGTSGDQAYGIGIRAAKNITIENMEIYNCWSDSIVVGYNQGVDSSNVKILNCVLHDNKRQGISIVGCDTVLVSGCEIYNISGKMPQSGIDIEPDGDVARAKNITIDACYIHDTESASVIVGGNTPTNVKIVNNNLDGLNVSEGEDVLVDNCRITSLYGAASTNIFVSNSNIARVVVAGSSLLFNNCNFQNVTADAIIQATLDYFPDRISERVSFNHCRFKTTSECTRLMLLSGISDAPYYPEKIIEFVACKIDLKAGVSFSNRMPGEELRLEGCELIAKDNAYQAFTINNTNPTRFIVRNSRIRCSATMNYLFSTNANVAHYVDFSNNEFPTFTQMLYCDSGATGTIRLFNNRMSNTKIIGTNTITVYSANDVMDESKLPAAINTALAQAKASGEFDGKDGEDYVLTDADKSDMVAQVKTSLTSETWTFELENGSTVSKVVLLG